MGKKNGGINDRHDASGEQSSIDGNSGISNTLDGEEIPDPPETMERDQAERAYRNAKTPTKRHSDIV